MSKFKIGDRVIGNSNMQSPQHIGQEFIVDHIVEDKIYVTDGGFFPRHKLDLVQYTKVTDSSNSAFETQVGASHYKNMKIQPMEYALANNLNLAQGNVVKYVSRYKAKNGKEDLEKAIHCIQLLIEHEYGGNNE